ncbi:MAG: LysR family transcriptional regulator [Rhodomicrobiaceae bacterium]
MDIKQLRYFVAIVEEGSFSAAAARIGIAQPSLSQHIKGLEDRLGVSLLTRSSRGVMATDAGMLLLTHAREIIAALERAHEDVRMSGNEPMGTVAFGLPSSVSMVLSVPLAESVRLELPRINLRAVEAMSGFIRNWLQDQSIELGILYEIGSLRHMQTRLLLTEELYFFSAPDAWPLKTAPDEPVTLAEVGRQELVLPSGHHGLREMVDRYARTHGVSMRVVLEMDALTQIKTLVSRGSAYTILAPASAQDLVETGHLVRAPIVEPVMRRPVYLVRNPEKVSTRATREVERVTIEVVEDLVKRKIWPAELERVASYL